MKLNKVLIIAIIAGALAARIDATRSYQPQAVRQSVDRDGNEIPNKLDVKYNNEWQRFRKHSSSREIGNINRPQYQFTNDTATVLAVKESDGVYSIYVKDPELSQEEREIMIMNRLQN